MEIDQRSTRLTRAVSKVAGWAGSFSAILIVVGIVAVWLIAGLISPNRSLVFDLLSMTATLTAFVMVFIIQNTQNREGRAVQTKLDAQAHALRRIIDHLEIEHEVPLAELAGLEEAPETQIKDEQKQVRQPEAARR